MQTSFQYRAYQVEHDGSAFSASSLDGEELQLRSKNLLRLTRAIDTLWNALEGKVSAPVWLDHAIDMVDLDAAADAMVVIGGSKEPVSLFPLLPKIGTRVRAAA